MPSIEVITRACGHAQEFTPKGDQYDDARRQKMRAKHCPACGRKKNEEDNAKQPRQVRKGQEMKLLPEGTAIALTRGAEKWGGTLSADGVQVQAEMGGAMGVLQKLARKWLQAKGARLQGRVQE